MDDDKNRKLNMDEFKKGVEEYGLNFSKPDIEQLFHQIDIDNSGTIDFEEFLRKLRVCYLFNQRHSMIFFLIFQPPMNNFRLDLIAKAFAKLDRYVKNRNTNFIQGIFP